MKLRSIAAAMVLVTAFTLTSWAQRARPAGMGRTVTEMTQILGRPTDRSIVLSVLTPDAGDVFVEFGTKTNSYSQRTAEMRLAAAEPAEIPIGSLLPDTRYYYRLNHRKAGAASFSQGEEYSFHTQRSPGATFTFTVQGDSHPERRNQMFDPDLYRRTMQNVHAGNPDFHIALGDDFSIDRIYNQGVLSADSVAQLYIGQRNFLGMVGRSAALFLVNGNHEQAAQYLLNGTPTSVPVLAGKARNMFYPLPAPDEFYGGDTEPVEFLGLRRDYYAFTWGDALFVTIDPYWHSPVQIDSGLGGQADRGGGRGGGKPRDGWAPTMGDAQYRWLRQTLAQSHAKYKFVFAHHVLGSYRGAIEAADLFEWGGRNRQGVDEFAKKRPGWELPVHRLMAKYGVTIFFQGHDHLFARQQKDDVIYQETPNPADNSYTAFNREAYLSGDVLPNSGHLRVTVSQAGAQVDYVRSWLPQDETPSQKNGTVAFSYAASGRKSQ